MVAADREGNWDFHVDMASDLMPVFVEFDSLCYLKKVNYIADR